VRDSLVEDESDRDHLISFCADLVTLRRTEAFPLRLLRDHGPGQWVRVHDVCQQSGISTGEVTPGLVAAWLPDPFGDPEYTVIIFFDDETKQSFAAHYNRRRLLDDNPAKTETVSGTGGRKGRRAGKVPGAVLGAAVPRRRRSS
jgi:hypothetical protein